MSSNGKLPWFPFYPRDFILDNKVMAMTPSEVGCYFKLLCIAWNEDPAGTIPDDDDTIRRWLFLTIDEWLSHKPRVTAAFTLKEGRWHQKRMMSEAAKGQHITHSRQDAARARWMQKQCKSNAKASADGMQPESKSNDARAFHNHSHNHNHIKNKRRGDGVR